MPKKECHALRNRWEKPRTKKEAPKDATSFKVGDTVEVGGLQGAPQHNGKLGIVQKFDAEKGRYVLQIKGMKKPLAVKPGNLTLSKPLEKGFLDSAAAKKPAKGKKKVRLSARLFAFCPLSFSPAFALAFSGTF